MFRKAGERQAKGSLEVNAADRFGYLPARLRNQRGPHNARFLLRELHPDVAQDHLGILPQSETDGLSQSELQRSRVLSGQNGGGARQSHHNPNQPAYEHFSTFSAHLYGQTK
jgi:hypothetical protein